ncbi:hypothetical protein QCN27_03815 [Cereibacter sp. SYSU M97828]|nr:hypothetical protein [Cereibacter flavus]
MKLNDMSLQDLAELQAQLEVIENSAAALAALGGDVRIDMVPGNEICLASGWTMPGADAGDWGPKASLIEASHLDREITIETEISAPASPGADPERRAGKGTCSSAEKAESPLGQEARDASDTGESPEAKAEAPGGGDLSHQPAAAGEPSLRVGALNVEERANIIEWDAEGVTRTIIAQRLNRRLQTVSLFLDHPRQKEAKAAKADTTRAEPTTSKVPAEPPVTAIPQASLPVAPTVVPDNRPTPQREIGAALDKLKKNPKWSIHDDLELLEAFGRGMKLNEIAADFGMDPSDIRWRHADLTSMIRDDRGFCTLDGQKFLLLEVRRRAMRDRGAAA